MEIIVVDNASTDGSEQLAIEMTARVPERLRYIQNGANLGYCEGNNRGAAAARGIYLLFLNNDTWLERDCLEKLIDRVEAVGADAASPMVCNYETDEFQTSGATGFDLLGHLTGPSAPLQGGTIFAAPGCAFLVKRDVFWKVGGFDPQLFMYADEADLAWRLALSGFRTVTVPEARLHHRGAALANPKGGGTVVEFRTNEFVRFYVSRNGLLTLLKNAQHLLLVLAVFQIMRIVLEAALVLLLLRRWRTIKRVYLRALTDCWRLRHHLREERRRIRQMRRHGDLWMLRFFRLNLACWREIRQVWTSGLPKIDPSEF
jgi:GT2 family glycosyltransferase